jgi:hypothetical protein
LFLKSNTGESNEVTLQIEDNVKQKSFGKKISLICNLCCNYKLRLDRLLKHKFLKWQDFDTKLSIEKVDLDTITNRLNESFECWKVKRKKISLRHLPGNPVVCEGNWCGIAALISRVSGASCRGINRCLKWGTAVPLKARIAFNNLGC